jgi:REP element-mobilizing transposase RayT
MATRKQLFFPGFEKVVAKDFGGSFITGHAREQRPISLKRPMHLVLRSSLAVGDLSFLRPKRRHLIRTLVEKIAREKGVKVYRFANSGNHLHMIVLPHSRRAFHAFIRTLSGLIARRTLGVERGRAKGIQFWDALPFTRILEWGKDYRQACGYLRQNVLEALGFISYRPRRTGGRRPKTKPPD